MDGSSTRLVTALLAGLSVHASHPVTVTLGLSFYLAFDHPPDRKSVHVSLATAAIEPQVFSDV